jgi:hypothetical protein
VSAVVARYASDDARGRARWAVLLTAVAAIGVALRVWTQRWGMSGFNSDEAVVGLMARHLLDGEVTTFFWGQPYGGTQEVWLTAPIFWIFGSSQIALRIVPLILVAVATLLVWRVGRRTIGEPAATVAALVYWVWPPFVFHQLSHQLGFYGSDLVYCTLLLLLALRVVERPDRTRVAVFGLVFGLAFWQTAQIVPVAVPIVAWTIWKRPQCLRHIGLALPAAAVGALPWIVWNAGHGWESLVLNGRSFDQYQQSLRHFVSPLLPMTLGLRSPYTAEPLVPKALMLALYAGLIGLFAYGAWKTRRRNASLLYAVVAVFPFVYALSPKTAYNTSFPNYIVVLTPLLPLLLAQLARSYARGAVLVALACAVTLVTLHRMDYWSVHQSGGSVEPHDFRPLIATLDRLGVDRVYSDYWVAYRLAFDTNERIVGVENHFKDMPRFENGRAVMPDDPLVRYRPYERLVQRGRPAFVFYRKVARTSPIVPRLVQHGYSRHAVGKVIVYAPPPSG